MMVNSLPDFQDGDEIIGPNSYVRYNGVWMLMSGVGQECVSDNWIRRLLSIEIPVVKKDVSKTTRQGSNETKAYYVYYRKEE